ncbi:unnamed protein product [Brassica napus]|uniref:(rape) hypothetical protein n=1 Tax=Brassica napus TaxID=3708 RepID=A0A816I5X4_BRANA|nr:unnamed protein product [Brassica napus]
MLGAESWQGGGLIATDHCCGGAHTAESGQVLGTIGLSSAGSHCKESRPRPG